MSTVWDSKETLIRLEKQRDDKRKRGRISFDCFNLKIKPDKAGRAYCSKGKLLGTSLDGTIDLHSVLRGLTSGTCKTCPLFSTEEDKDAV